MAIALCTHGLMQQKCPFIMSVQRLEGTEYQIITSKPRGWHFFVNVALLKIIRHFELHLFFFRDPDYKEQPESVANVNIFLLHSTL